MADQALPRGPAPRGFWKDPQAEMMLLTVILAKIDSDVISEIDMEEISRIVGEGKLSKPSCKAKLTQLVGKGRQRVADSEARLRAENDRAPPPADGNDEPRLATNSQPPPPDGNDRTKSAVHHKRKRERKEKIDAPNRLGLTPSKKKRKKKHQKKVHTAQNAAEHSRSDGDAGNGSSSPEGKSQTNGTAHVKKETVQDSAMAENPALQSKGQTRDSAIEVDDLSGDSDESEDDDLPAAQSSTKRVELSLAIRSSREPLLPVLNDASVQHSARRPAGKEARYYGPSGRIHRVPVMNRTRWWQAPYTRQISIARTDKEMMNNWRSEQGRQPRRAQ